MFKLKYSKFEQDPLNIKDFMAQTLFFAYLKDTIVSNKALSCVYLPTIFQSSDILVNPHSKYENFCYAIQNHSSVTLFTFCVYKCLMNNIY